MLKVFHTFKAYPLLRLVNMSAICCETMHSAGRGPTPMFYGCEVWSRSSSNRRYRHLADGTRGVHLRVPRQQSLWTDAGGSALHWRLRFLRCNRNNPIKWQIAFHSDYWASVSPAVGGRWRGGRGLLQLEHTNAITYSTYFELKGGVISALKTCKNTNEIV